MARPNLCDAACPCGSLRSYQECCGCFILANQTPRTAEQLMRSRYTAYALGEEAYLLSTWHASTRPPVLGLGTAEPVRWLGLRVLRVEQGGPDDREGVVEFIARYKPAGRAARLHEISRFIKEGEHWYYVGGALDPGRLPEGSQFRPGG